VNFVATLRSVAPFSYSGIFVDWPNGFYRVCLDSLCDGFGLFLDVFGAYFKAFAFMSRSKIKGHNRTQ
jgi:hypothetical protein